MRDIGLSDAAKASENSAVAAGVMIAPIAERLATGLTGVLNSVLEEVYQHTGDQVRIIASHLEERIHGIEAALRSASGLEDRLERLATEHRESLEALRRAHEEASGAVRILQEEALDGRVRAVEERVGLLEQWTRDMDPQLAGALARLDRHSDALQWLEQRQGQRVTALSQFLDTVAHLKKPEPYRRKTRASATSA
jgi:DNA repair ATPase RecN